MGRPIWWTAADEDNCRMYITMLVVLEEVPAAMHQQVRDDLGKGRNWDECRTCTHWDSSDGIVGVCHHENPQLFDGEECISWRPRGM